MRILSVVAGFFPVRTGGQTDRQRDAERKRKTEGQRDRVLYSRERLAKFIITFRNFANLPKVVMYSVTLCGECRTTALHG